MTDINTKNELQKIVDYTAKQYNDAYTNDTLYELLNDDAFDAVYYMDSQGEYMGVRVAVTLGGPSIYIDTYARRVDGYWGSETAQRYFFGDVADAINDIYRELFAQIRG